MIRAALRFAVAASVAFHVSALASPVAAFGLADGSRLRIASMLPARRLAPGAWMWARGASRREGRLVVVVDRRLRVMSVFIGGREIGTAAVETGADRMPTPAGAFPILSRSRIHASSRYDADMPYTLRLTGDGVSIHQAVVGARSASHGCVGVPAGFAARLYAVARVGDLVSIS